MSDGTVSPNAHADRAQLYAIRSALAQNFVERAKIQGYRGKKRDAAAIDFWCGAIALAEALDKRGVERPSPQQLVDSITLSGVFIVARDGFAGIERLANEPAPHPEELRER